MVKESIFMDRRQLAAHIAEVSDLQGDFHAAVRADIATLF